jgi:Leucine-rich repeat (LRR) protein
MTGKVTLYVLILLLIQACRIVNTTINSSSTADLSKKNLKDIPEEVFENKNIKVLYLYGNELDSIPGKIGQLDQLEELYIGKNHLKTLPKEIGQLENLKVLSVQFNDLAYLPAEIGSLKKLERLVLNQNSLRSLPHEIGQLTNLQDLQLKMNWLDSLPKEIGNCSNLRFVYLNRNNLRSLPESINQLTNLKELYLAGSGQLVQLPESLCDLRMLEILEVDDNIVMPTCLIVNRANRLKVIYK